MRNLFTFTLDPLPQIEPWGPPERPTLSWFGLSYGTYGMNIGGREVFAYSGSALLERGWGGDSRVDYQVARLWEDVMSVMPWAMISVPADVIDLVLNGLNERGLREWSRAILDDELADAALGFVRRRMINSAHLVDGPDVLFLRCSDNILVQFDARGGSGLWDPEFSAEWMHWDEFMSQVRSFHERFMGAMEERVRECMAGARQGVDIDLQLLSASQADLSTYLDANTRRERALSFADDWDAVRAALAEVL